MLIQLVDRAVQFIQLQRWRMKSTDSGWESLTTLATPQEWLLSQV